MSLADDLGTPYELTLDGVTYKFAQITQKLRAVFEQYITDQCFRTVQAARSQLPEHTYHFLLAQHYEKLAQGAYDIFGSAGRAFLAEDRHAIHWLWVFLTPHHQLTKEQVEQLFYAHQDELYNMLVELVSKKNFPVSTASGSTSS